MTRPLVDFDHNAVQFARDPWSSHASLRAAGPVAWTESWGGYWVISGYQEVAEVARNTAQFSSATLGIPRTENPLTLIPVQTDPPDHTFYRKVLLPVFSPKGPWLPTEDEIRDLADACINSFIGRGSGDLVLDFASPLTALVVLELMGLPTEDWESIAGPIHALAFSRGDSPEYAAALGEQAPLMQQLREGVADRRERPRERDLITYLTRFAHGGRTLTDTEIFETLLLTLYGGLDTSTSAIGNVLYHLHQDHHSREKLRANPDLLPAAVEEFLRWLAPVQGHVRTATADCELGGQLIRKGERVWLFWAAANRDPDEFPHADELQLDRFPNRQIDFGIGAHRCLGAHLARVEMKAALEQLLTRVSDYAILEDHVGTPDVCTFAFGKLALPAVFSPGEIVPGLPTIAGLPHPAPGGGAQPNVGA